RRHLFPNIGYLTKNKNLMISCSSNMGDGTNEVNNNGGASKCGSGACHGGGIAPPPPRRVQVTAKILFGSVSAISTMKHTEKLQRKRSQ
ncbi:hypothetical protein LSTR_LSTR008763, partial [Laodelphax striatellus]